MSKDKLVMGPDGEPLTIDDLPERDSKWTPKRKAKVVAAIAGGLLSAAEAIKRYGASEEEIEAWARGYRARGLEGVRCGRAR